MSTGPLIDVPVVVGTDDTERQFLVVPGREHASREPGERGEVERRQHTTCVHVQHPLVDVPTASADLVEGRGLDAVLVLGSACNGIQADIGDHLAVEHPHVVACVGVLYRRNAIAKPQRHVLIEHVRRLDEMIVDADEDHVLDVHGVPPVPPVGRLRGVRPRLPEPDQPVNLGVSAWGCAAGTVVVGASGTQSTSAQLSTAVASSSTLAAMLLTSMACCSVRNSRSYPTDA